MTDRLKDPQDWASGDDPMTDAQRSYLETLSRQAGEEMPENMSKSEASQRIDELRAKTGLADQGDSSTPSGPS